MRILADAHIARSIVEPLRASGHDVAWAAEMAQRISDTTHIEMAVREGRSILTEDIDFTDLLSTGSWGQASPAVIQLRLGPLGRAARSARVLAAIIEIEPVEQGVVYSVEPTRIRKHQMSGQE